MSDILFWYSISCVVAFVLLTVAFISHERSRSDLDKCINGEREYSPVKGVISSVFWPVVLLSLVVDSLASKGGNSGNKQH